ncbi:MAG: hypothetical protein DSY80_04865 [Desulfocapsa sp.]|nr:MAG: hypothetical protein DSY80_04865 [Desulfocapsa sp.]
MCKKTVNARLDIEIFVDCPNCDRTLDILNESDTDNYNHNDEGDVLGQACPKGSWIEEHKKFEVFDITCTHCKETFNVKGLEW